MRRIWMAAALAVPLSLCTVIETANANPTGYEYMGFGGFAFNIFPNIHQHGPLFNYGPYYGYYPFKPYGPWDAYLRYDPFFYGDPYANWGAQGGNYAHGSHVKKGFIHGGFGLGGWLQSHGCLTCGFWHASWMQGGWFRGHTWLSGGFGDGHKSGCASCCGGVASTQPIAPSGDVTARYSGFGTPEQSAVFYSATPTLDPRMEFVPAAGTK